MRFALLSRATRVPSIFIGKADVTRDADVRSRVGPINGNAFVLSRAQMKATRSPSPTPSLPSSSASRRYSPYEFRHYRSNFQRPLAAPSGQAVTNGEQQIEVPLNKQRNDRHSAHPSTDGAAVIPRIFSECDLGPAEACQSIREISGFHGDSDKMSHPLAGERDILS